MDKEYPVGVAYQEGPGHTGLAGMHGGSDPGLGSIGGPSGGPPATEEQTNYVKRLLFKQSDTEMMQSLGSGQRLENGFLYYKTMDKRPEGFWDLSRREAGKAGVVLGARYIKWRNSIDVSKMSKAQASTFLDSATNRLGGSLQGFVRLQTGGSRQSTDRYFQGLVNETRTYIKKYPDGEEMRKALGKSYGFGR